MAEQGGDQRNQEPEKLMRIRKMTQSIHGSDLENYTEQLEFFFLGSGICNAERKKAILIANVPAESFQIIKDLIAPEKLTDPSATYERIVQVMKVRVKPEISTLVSRYCMNLTSQQVLYESDNRVCQSQESVTNYVKALKHLAFYCIFTN